MSPAFGEPVEPVVKMMRHASRVPTFARAFFTLPVKRLLIKTFLMSFTNSVIPTAPFMMRSSSFWNCTQCVMKGDDAMTSSIMGRKSATGVLPRKKYAFGFMRSMQYWISFALSRRSSGAIITPMR